jgi:protein gp37
MKEPIPVVRSAEDLRTLTSEVLALDRAVKLRRKQNAHDRREMGLRLAKIKAALGHGRWLGWLAEHDFEPTYAKRCIRLSKSVNLTDLESEWKRICGALEADPNPDTAPPSPPAPAVPPRGPERVPAAPRVPLAVVGAAPAEEDGGGYVTLPAGWDRLSGRERRALLATVGRSRFVFQADNENVGWALWTWNPVSGCGHNCPYCYARDIVNRLYPGEDRFGPRLWPGRLTAVRNTPFPQEKIDAEPDPARLLGLGNVFVVSMGDLFGLWVPAEIIEAVLAECRAAPQWRFLFLTKYPLRMSEFDFPTNAWVGITVDSQARVANAEKAFRKVRAGVKWLSVEPMLERLTFTDLGAFQWVVLGGASPSTRTPEWVPPRAWVADLERQAAAAGVPVYEKTNLHGRTLQYPGDAPLAEPEAAPAALLYPWDVERRKDR